MQSSIDNLQSAICNHQSPNRLILHVDVDAFFASVEQLLVPSLRGRPVVVGSGCIASCSYEARASGLHAGMSLSAARKACPEAVILEGNYQVYRCFAEHIWQVCRLYTTAIETHLDEAYGDATGMEGVHGDPLAMGKKLQQQVLTEVGLPVSVGLATSRMVAGIASHLAKPRGVSYVPPGTEADFLADLPVTELTGVGHKTAAMLHDMNIRTVADLRAIPLATMRAMLGRRGETLFDRCRGVPGEKEFTTENTESTEKENVESGEWGVESGEESRSANAQLPTPYSLLSTSSSVPSVVNSSAIPKTISRETTFHHRQCDLGQIRGMLHYLLERAMRAARHAGLLAGCVEVSIRYDDFRSDAATRGLCEPSENDDEVLAVAMDLLGRLYRRRVALRHVGVTLSRFSPRASGAMLFDLDGREHRHQLYQALDVIRDRFGHSSVVTGKSIELLGQLEQNDYGFVLRTPSLTK